MESSHRLRPGERAFALALVLASGFVFTQAYAISGFSGLTTGGVMPMLASAVMAVSSLSILAQTLRKAPDPKSDLPTVVGFLLPLRVVLFGALVAAYAAAIPYLGFMLASGLFLFVAIWALWRSGPLWALALAAGSMGAIYLLFRIVFQVVLPMGSLWR